VLKFGIKNYGLYGKFYQELAVVVSLTLCFSKRGGNTIYLFFMRLGFEAIKVQKNDEERFAF